jgi:hypothetical protein
MDRKARRMHRIRFRSRRTKLVAAFAVGAASVVVLAAAAFGQQGGGAPEMPKPKVDRVDLTADAGQVDAGWEGQVGTHANLVAVQWNGDSSAQYTFEFRNADGKWLKAADSGTFDNGPDPGTGDAKAGGATPQTKNVTEPVWVGKNVTGVRVRLETGSAQDVTLHVIDSTTGTRPGTNVESTSPTPTTPPAPPPSAPPASAGGGSGGVPASSTTTTTTTQPLEGFGLGQGLATAALASLLVAFIVRRRRLLAVLVVMVVAVGIACAPTKDGPGSSTIPNAIVPRSSWAPDLGWNWDACPGGPEYAYVANAIVHHTVNSNDYGPGDSVGLLRGIWAYHVQSLGYCDIAYNFLIDNYGVAFEGRLGGIDQPVIGAHALDWNTGTTGIAVLGTFSSVRPSDAALGTLQDLIRWKFKVHGVNPFDVDYAHILGHRDTYQTECPGDAFYNYLPATRDYVKFSW